MASKDTKRTIPRKSVPLKAPKSAPKSAGKVASKNTKPSTKRVPKPAPKRVIKPARPVTPAAQLRTITKDLQKQQRQLQVLSKQLTSARRALGASRKPDTIKAAAKFARQAERETQKQIKQIAKTTSATEKFVKQAFKFYKNKPQPKSLYKAAKQTSTASTIVHQHKPVVKRVPKKSAKTTKKTVVKSAKKPSTKAPKKATKKATKRAVKRVPKKATKTAKPAAQKKLFGKQYERIGFHKVTKVQRAALSAQEPSTDGKELLGTNQMFALKVRGNMGNEAYPTLQRMRDKVTEYLQRKVPVGYLQFGVFQMPERTRSKPAFYAAQRQSERNERAKDKQVIKQQQERIKELEKLFRKKGGK